MEAFYRTHAYLVEHTNAPVRRDLMDEIDWNDRLIGIKGTRGVGKTTFLLQYAKEKFGTDRSCLFINMNNFYFSGHGIVEFAAEFQRRGGKVLLIDQVFKYPEWSKELRMCYDRFPNLKIVFTGSSVMRLKEENMELRDIVKSYNLRGFSFREYLNLQTGMKFHAYPLEEILSNHEQDKEITIFVGRGRTESAECQPTGKRHTDLPRHSNELHQVSGRRTTHQYGLSERRRIPQEAVEDNDA